MSFIELRAQLPAYGNILAKETADGIVKTLGKNDKKHASTTLTRFFDAVVSVKNWDEDKRLKSLAKESYSYLKKHKKIRGDSFKNLKKKFKRSAKKSNHKRNNSKKKEQENQYNDPGSIANAGNTCYIGATIQALRHSEGFMNALNEKKGGISEKLQHIIKTVQGNNDTTIAVDKKQVDELLNAVRTEGFQQTVGEAGDAAELCSFLITQCRIPQVEYITEQDGQVRTSYVTVLDQQRRNKSVDLVAYFAQEKLFLDKDTLPSFLPVVINQMEEGTQGNLTRIPHELHFDLLSSLGEEQKQCVYKLKAIVTSGGHAVAWIPTVVNNAKQWTLYNDSKVEVVTASDELQKLICQKAYLLLFDPVDIVSKQ